MSPRTFARYLTRFGSLRGCWLALKYPGIHTAAGTRLSIEGSFLHGERCSIGTGSNIIVPKHALLELGDDCSIGRYVELGPGGSIKIGDQTSIQDRCIFVGDVAVGRYCSISLNVHLSSGRHYFELFPAELIKDQDRYAVNNPEHSSGHNRAVIIEDDCWIGINAVIMPGVCVGKGAVVGANSVVTQDVAPYAVVAGAPAKLIKVRLAFSPPRQIEHRERAHWPYFYSGFAVSRDAMESNAALGGLLCKGNALLALDAAGAQFLCLSAKSIGRGGATISFADQRAELTPQFREVTFKLPDGGQKSDRLALRSEPSNAVWALEKAWVR